MNDNRDKILKKYLPMTDSQLKAVVKDYATAFPSWTLHFDKTAIFRRSGPVEQMIWFQKMSSAAYRPTHVINTTILKIPRMLNQLPFRPSAVELRAHDRKFGEMLAAMERQFQPDIRKPLDPAEVLLLCETEAKSMPDSTNNLAMLAILYAWLGRKAEALECCERMQHCLLPALAPMPEWEDAMRKFGRELAAVTIEGKEIQFLERLIDAQQTS